jgi:hypothetical protein
MYKTMMGRPFTLKWKLMVTEHTASNRNVRKANLSDVTHLQSIEHLFPNHLKQELAAFAIIAAPFEVAYLRTTVRCQVSCGGHPKSAWTVPSPYTFHLQKLKDGRAVTFTRNDQTELDAV